ncbi:TraX family protein [Luteimonas saliphila]|uniref:TraX family protein n=1 Tax=Luteimonas saliphila TaxID=2804919 RepID=UPI00192DB294|nr:TraX family protein [Luteimonas saliphila]
MVIATLPARPAALSDTGALFLKLVAFGLMVLDHLDWFLFAGDLGAHATAGRIVAPTFVLVLALNLQHVREPTHLRRLVLRLLAFGALAHVPYAYLQGAFVPLNILFTLALGVAIIGLWREGYTLWPALLLLAFGLVVDYAWLGAAAVCAAYWLTARGSAPAMVATVVAGLFAIWNASLWSFAVLPLVALAYALDGPAPRLKWLFYVGYPLHLVVLALIRSYL